MTKQERLNLLDKTLAFQNFDKPLVDVMIAYKRYPGMLEYLGAETERQFLDKLNSDFYYVSGRDISQNEGFLKYYKHSLPMDEKYRKCPLGITWLRGSYDSKFSADDSVSGPFYSEDVTAEEILQFPWPKASDFDFTPMLQECEENSDRILIGGLWTGLMGDSYRMMGMENFLMNTVLEPELVDTLVSRMAEMYLSLNDQVFNLLRGKLDIWYFGNDLGSQNALLMRPDTIEKLFFKHFKQWCDLAHSYGIHVMMHSCGCIGQIIPMLIEAGVEILDPIQVTAVDMDPESLAKHYGGKIVFHGGVDTQQVLPNSTQEEVIRHSRFVKDTLSATGGYIFSSSQILNADIPCENIEAMYSVVK